MTTSEENLERSRTVTWGDPAEALRAGRKVSGSELFEKMRRGEVPEPPYARLLGMELFDAGDGWFTMTMLPQECHYNPMGCVHGGILSTLLDSVMSAAVHPALPAGSGYLSSSNSSKLLKPVFATAG